MASQEVRSDLISASITRVWMEKHAPKLAASWPLDVNEATRGFVARICEAFPLIELTLASQSALAAAAIRYWKLTKVAYLGAGTPTPFSPTPDQLTLYTDANPVVLAEAERAGYKTAQVDIRNPADLKRLEGVETLVTTGLMHFLPDEAARGVFALLAGAGFKAFVFNHMPEIDQSYMHIADQWSRFGFKLIPRTVEEISALAGNFWHVRDAVASNDLLADDEYFGPFSGPPRLFHVFYLQNGA